MGHGRLPSRVRLGFPASAVLLLAMLPGCPNSVGITCPEGNPDCDIPDQAVPLDLAFSPDLTTCECPDGCCNSKAECKPLPPHPACRSASGTCFVCPDGGRSDTCDPILGVCTCGSRPICGLGSKCVSGVCKCDETTCPNGCCQPDGMCVVPGTLIQCRTPGGECSPCVGRGDTCNANIGCSCGGGPPCVDGLRCEMGKCICDQRSCPGGCCLANANPGGLATCEMPTTTNCGLLGDPCKRCDAKANACDRGHCVCGNLGRTCDTGNTCSPAGVCTCLPSDCTGCCGFDPMTNVNICMPGNTNTACGPMNGSCRPCPPGEMCQGGSCTCGLLGRSCSLGDVCSNGMCICSPACPGCCGMAVGGTIATCQPGTSDTACGSQAQPCLPCDRQLNHTCSASGVCMGP